MARQSSRSAARAVVRAYKSLVEQVRSGDWSGLVALLYNRVSEDDDKKQGRSVAEQSNHAHGVILAHPGCRIGGVFTDVDTGASEWSSGTRHDFERLKDAIRRGEGHILILWKADRRDRNLDDYNELRKLSLQHGVVWYYDGRVLDLTDPHDNLIAGIDALMAQYSSGAIHQNVSRAVEANARKGRPHGRKQYGYERHYHPRTRALTEVIPHPDQAPVVQLIFDWFTAYGWTTSRIAAELNDRRVPPLDRKRVRCPECGKHATWHRDDAPDGKVRVGRHKPPGRGTYCEGVNQLADVPPEPYWDIYQITRILRNAGYAGLRTHLDDTPGEAMWPALVTPDVFHAAQRILNDEKRLNHEILDGKARHLLSGIARCGVCGGPLRRVPNHTARPIYQCMGRGDRRLGKFCTAIVAEELEATVMEALIDRMSQPDALTLLTGDTDGRAKEAVAEAARLQAALDEHLQAARKGAMGLSDVISDLTRQVQEALGRAVPQPTPPLVAAMAEHPDPARYWAQAALEQRRSILSWVMTPYLHPDARPEGRIGFAWRNGGPPVMAQLEVRPAQIMYERTCEECGRRFQGRGRYCAEECYPSKTKEARRAWYAVNKDRILAERKADREEAGPGPRALKRQEVLRLLAEEPQLSDREIGVKAGVSTQAVWKIRRATPGTRPSRQWGRS